jgi:hypothetical protein
MTPEPVGTFRPLAETELCPGAAALEALNAELT